MSCSLSLKMLRISDRQNVIRKEGVTQGRKEKRERKERRRENEKTGTEAFSPNGAACL